MITSAEAGVEIAGTDPVTLIPARAESVFTSVTFNVQTNGPVLFSVNGGGDWALAPVPTFTVKARVVNKAIMVKGARENISGLAWASMT